MDQKYTIPLPLYFVIGSLLILVVVTGVFFNGTGLIVFATNKNLRSPTNMFVISLLLGDFGISCGAVISLVNSFNKLYVWGDGVCIFEGFWLYLMGLTNLYTLCAISFDRYIKIAKPLQSSKITNRVALIAIIVIWFQGLCWACFPFFGWGVYTYEPARISCAVDWTTNDPVSASYNIAITIWSFFIPLVLVIYANYHVYMTIKNIATTGVWDITSSMSRSKLKKEKQMFKTILLMLSSFIGSWTPYVIVSMWAIIDDARSIPVYIITIPAIVAKSSCIWDPLIYVATNRQFRKAFYNKAPCLFRCMMKLETDTDKNKASKEMQPKTPHVRGNRVLPSSKEMEEPVTQIDDLVVMQRRHMCKQEDSIN